MSSSNPETEIHIRNSRFSSTNKIPTEKCTFELAIKNQNWKWKVHCLTVSPHPKCYCDRCLPLNSAAFPTTGPLPPKMCCLGSLLGEMGTI